MMKFKLFGKPLQVSPIGIGLYLLALTLLLSLGFWQLDRGQQKRQLLDQQHAAASAAPLSLEQRHLVDIDGLRYRQASVSGHYDHAKQLLLDNQIVDGKVGYVVFTPFIVDGWPRAILVNRGWVPANSDRRQLPDVDFQAGGVTIQARINQLPSVGIKLAGMEQPTPGWPAVVQLLDAEVLAGKFGYPLESFQLELSPEAEHGYRREWRIAVTIPPEKHQAYAVQWFGLAIALSALFLWISLRKPQ